MSRELVKKMAIIGYSNYWDLSFKEAEAEIKSNIPAEVDADDYYKHLLEYYEEFIRVEDR